MKLKKLKTKPGSPFPIGSSVRKNGVNFSVFSKNAKSIELLLFDRKDDIKPSSIIELKEEKKNKSYFYWHIYIEGLKAGQYYAYRVDGEYNPSKSFAYDKSKVLIDPYAKGIYASNYNRKSAMVFGKDNLPYAYKSVVVAKGEYDWEGDRPLRTDLSDLTIYEMHVGGFTKSESSGIESSRRGTYSAVIDKIPYLKSLGINAIELLPVYAFDDQDAPQGKTNYWGYSPLNFFAIHNAYSVDKDPISAINEFKDMVKALHKAGIEVILDVVYNHTSESNYDGPLQCFRGFENKTYYILDVMDRSKYQDFTGCGNSVNANHSVTHRMIIDSLKYWVEEMHVDGFRFDLASVMSRDEKGVPVEKPPVLWSIESEPTLACTKLIAEAWDATGLYQLGIFTGDKWAEWNGKYRDDLRRFVKGDNGLASTIASRIVGSPDVFRKNSYTVSKSIHFVTCHDGFTLNDVVSYNHKHNSENGENNMDGSNDNFSWNCGVEGHTNDPEIEKLRLKQIKNFFVITLLSQGTPMILMGDEVRRTQNGNNNAYCLDNQVNWFDWSLVEKNKELLEFVRSLINTTRDFEVLRCPETLKITSAYKGGPFITWHGTELHEPDWSNDSHTLGFEFHFPDKKERILVLMNMFWDKLKFEIPEEIYGKWNLMVDTSQGNINTRIIIDSDEKLTIGGRSVMVLIDK